MSKVRYVDFHPSEYIAGVFGHRLSFTEQGVYWMVCSLIMDTGQPVDNDARWLARLSTDSTKKVRHALDSLIEKGVLIVDSESKLSQNRAQKEHQKAQERTKKARFNGLKGGRPPNEIKDIEKPEGSISEKPNQEPITTNHYKKEEYQVSETEVSDLPAKIPKSGKRQSYPDEFERLWKAYPTDKLMSKKMAYAAWQRVDGESRALILSSIPAFRAFCSKDAEYRPVHLVRYITQERYLGFVNGGSVARDPSTPPDPSMPSDEELRKRYATRGPEVGEDVEGCAEPGNKGFLSGGFGGDTGRKRTNGHLTDDDTGGVAQLVGIFPQQRH